MLRARKVCFCLLPFAFCLFTACSSDGWKVREGTAAPDFTLKKLDGSNLSLSDFRGKIVVLDVFATWCGPCQEELPRLQRDIWEPLEKKGVVVLAVDFQEDADTVREMVKKEGYTFPVLLDEDGSVMSKLADSGIPRTFVIDREGKIYHMELGYNDALFQETQKAVAELLQKH